MKLFFVIVTLFLNQNRVLSCIISEDIECSCDNNEIECVGNAEDISSVQKLFVNISQIQFTNMREHLILNLTSLTFPANLNVTNLNISSLSLLGGLKNSKNDFFGPGWRDLKALEIQHSDIGLLEDRLFFSLHNLIALNLDSNEIFDIDPGVFFSLEKLEYLSLSKNQLKMASRDLLQYLPMLHTLILNGNNISFISNISIVSESLTKLSAQSCKIGGSLEEDSLSGTPNLTYIDLSLNQIENINSHALSTLANVETLNMSYNSIDNLGKDAFSKMKRLVILDLSNNKIKQMNTETFAQLTQLRNLNLSMNVLKAMLCDYTSNLYSLETLDLRHNVIRIISPGTLLSSLNIKELLLNGNILDETVCLSNLTKYVDIKLSDKDCNMADSCVSDLSEADTEDYYLDEEETTISTAITLLETTDKTPLSSITIMRTTTSFIPKDIKTETESPETSFFTTDNTSLNETVQTAISIKTESDFPHTTENYTTEEIQQTTYSDKTESDAPHTTKRYTTQDKSEETEQTTSNVKTESEFPITTEGFRTESDGTFDNNNESTTFISEITVNDSTQTDSLLKLGTESEGTSETSSTLLPDDVIPRNHSTDYFASSTENIVTTQYNNSEFSQTQEESTTLDMHSPTTSHNETTEEDYYDYDDEILSPNPEKRLTTSATIQKETIIDNTKIVLVNFTVIDDKLCVEYTIQGDLLNDSKCVLRSDLIKGKRGFDHIKCPPPGSNQLHCRYNDMYKFCLILFINHTPKSTECSNALLLETESHSRPPTTTELSNISINVTPVDYTTDGVTTLFPSTKVQIKNVTANFGFKLISFNVDFNDTIYALAIWTVNRNQSLSVCNLSLSLSSSREIVKKSYFSCSNYSYPFLIEDNIDEICLTAYHKLLSSETKCKRKVIINTGAAASRKKDHGFKNTSLIALGILLLIVTAIIILLIIRNLTKKKLNKDRYNVYFEEQNVQKRFSSIHQDTDVRYSFTPKE